MAKRLLEIPIIEVVFGERALWYTSGNKYAKYSRVRKTAQQNAAAGNKCCPSHQDIIEQDNLSANLTACHLLFAEAYSCR